MSIDWNKVATLLHVADRANQWPTLHAVRDAALADLSEMVEDAKEEIAAAEKRKADKAPSAAPATPPPPPTKAEDEASAPKPRRL